MSFEQPQNIPPIHPPALTPAEERQWAMLSHFSVLLNLVTGYLGVAVPLIIYMVYKDRSRYVAYHSLQALIFQGICWFGGSVLAIVTGLLSGVIPLIGLACLPLACIFAILPLIALVYGTIGGIQTNQGQDFQYWLAGDWARGMLNN
jgi:uncharacterized Tic20 family protein